LAVSSRQKVQEHFEKLTHKYPNRIFTEEGDSEEEIERKKNILDMFKQHVYIPPKDSESPKDDEQPILSDSGCFISITGLMISP